MLAGLEKKQGDKDHAASRTQETRNKVIGDSGRVTENYIETENKIESDTEIHRDEEYKENENLDNLQKYEYDYEFMMIAQMKKIMMSYQKMMIHLSTIITITMTT